MAEYLPLRTARVQNFCCFKDSGEVRLDDITVLLAENENGKTSFLRALAWFSSDELFDEADRWSEADGSTALDIVSLTFEMTEDADAALFDAGFQRPQLIRVVRNTTGGRWVEDAATGAPVGLFVPAEELFNETRDWLVSRLKEYDHPVAADVAASLQQATPNSLVATPHTTSITEAVIPTIDSEAGVELAQKLHELQTWETTATSSEDPNAYEILEPFLPRLIYFADLADEVGDEVTYEEVASDPTSRRTMVNLAKLVDVDLVGLGDESGHARMRLSQEASEGLTEQATLRWEGDPVTFRVQFDETRMIVSVDHKGRDQKPSRRSRGLQWFLGFYANFKAEARGDLAGAVLLLDEPGLHLHIKQQPKLVELFEDLTDSNQIVYSTHLPFLVPRGALHRLRLMLPGKEPGTIRVENDFHKLKTTADVMQPVRAALGMGIADAISLGASNVIVEGLVDTYYLDSMRAFCRDAQKDSLGDDVTLLAAGGAGRKMLPMASFILGERARGVVLLDDDRAGHEARRAIEGQFSDLVPIVFTNPAATRTADRLEIEDLFDREYFIDLVNDSYSSVAGFTNLASSDVDPAKSICDAIKEVFDTRGIGGFQKLRPARQLQVRVTLDEKPPDDDSLNAFAELFVRLNAALT
jgi:hypothetical protein